MTPEILQLAKTIWDYHHLHHTLVKSDCILTLGSYDTRVADRAASLYHEGWAPLLIFAGGLGRLTEGMWSEPEADLVARIAVEKGVPEQAILIENRSTNTGENILLVQELLRAKALNPHSLLSCKSRTWSEGAMPPSQRTGRKRALLSPLRKSPLKIIQPLTFPLST